MPEPPTHHDPIERLVAALPGPMRRGLRWLATPGRAWLRLPLGVLLVAGGLLGFLPLLGFWMVPVGLIVLAHDLPFLRRPTARAIAAVHGWWARRSAS